MPEPISQSFLKIFICYRRDDSSGHTGRLFDRLCTQFGEDQVFMDIEKMKPGADFVQVIEDAIGTCDILVAVIGRRWLTGIAENMRKLDDPNDFVRLEIVTALKRDVRVIPLLVEGATMPKASDLPDDMVKLSRRHAFELSDKRWRHDVGQLIRELETIATAPGAAFATVETMSVEANDTLRSLTSPLAGIFYSARSPAGQPFVSMDSRVEPDTVVCIIESMKFMNEVQAEMSGAIAAVYVKDGEIIEYGQPLFGIREPESVVMPAPPREATPAEGDEELHLIRSPIVGTFYRAPAPNADSFVRLGSHVEPQTVVCIIEAMYLMNEIQAEVSGTVRKIYVENGQFIEYGQPLFGIRK